MPGPIERAALGHDRPWAIAAMKLLRDAPPGSEIAAGPDGQPVLRRRVETIAALKVKLEMQRASWAKSAGRQ